MDAILGRLKWWAAFAYLNDNAVYSVTIPEHHERLTLSLGCIRRAGFKMKPFKCHFIKTELKTSQWSCIQMLAGTELVVLWYRE